jgi:hypothetical protein
VDSAERSVVKILVDGIAARTAEALGAVVILLWLKQTVPDGIVNMPLDTRWMSWVILGTVVSWLLITQKLRVQAKPQPARIEVSGKEIACERFPDQCPCTTELGKGIA